jgi:hypothetical protein
MEDIKRILEDSIKTILDDIKKKYWKTSLKYI